MPNDWTLALRQAVNAYARQRESTLSTLTEGLRVESVPKGQFLLAEGQYCRGIWFLNTGLLGTYRLVDGRQIYQEFNFSGEFATDVSALTTNEPTAANLIAIEDSQTVFLSKELLFKMYGLAPEFQDFGRTLLASLLVERTNYGVRQTTMTARERYDHLVNERPEMIQRIPLQSLSSYLGMSRETLSRVRKKS